MNVSEDYIHVSSGLKQMYLFDFQQLIENLMQLFKFNFKKQYFNTCSIFLQFGEDAKEIHRLFFT